MHSPPGRRPLGVTRPRRTFSRGIPASRPRGRGLPGSGLSTLPSWWCSSPSRFGTGWLPRTSSICFTGSTWRSSYSGRSRWGWRSSDTRKSSCAGKTCAGGALRAGPITRYSCPCTTSRKWPPRPSATSTGWITRATGSRSCSCWSRTTSSPATRWPRCRCHRISGSSKSPTRSRAPNRRPATGDSARPRVSFSLSTMPKTAPNPISSRRPPSPSGASPSASSACRRS